MSVVLLDRFVRGGCARGGDARGRAVRRWTAGAALSLCWAVIAPPGVCGSDRDGGTPPGVYDLSELAAIPGIAPAQPAPPDVVDGVDALARQYADTVGAVIPADGGLERDDPPRNGYSPDGEGGVPAPDILPPPPAMDAGDPNPDRINLPPLQIVIPPAGGTGTGQ